MTNASIEGLLRQGEQAREHGDHALALSCLGQAIIQAGQEERYAVVVNALAHKLLIYKDLYTYTHKHIFLELMRSEAEAGLRIVEQYTLNGQPKAVMLLRLGSYFFEKEDFSAAVQYFTQAVAEIGEENMGEASEYLSYLGRAQVKAGQTDKGVGTLERALSLAEQSEDLRPFHKLVTLSGIELRLADVYFDIGRTEEAEKIFTIALQQSKELHTVHSMSVRLEQAQQFGKAKGFLKA